MDIAAAQTTAPAADSTDVDAYIARAGALDLRGVAWQDAREQPLAPEVVYALRHIQAVEHHVVALPRTIYTRRAVRDARLSSFFVAWLYGELFHGRALKQFLDAAGHGVIDDPCGHGSVADAVDRVTTELLSKLWPGFFALYMTWGSVQELTTLVSYQRLVALGRQPVLVDVLNRIIRDEAIHFHFYFHEAKARLADRRTARIARFFVDRFWAPVGAGVRPKGELQTVIGTMYAGADGLAAARRIDGTIRQLPGFEDVALFEAWTRRRVDGAVLGWPPEPGAAAAAA
jgi:hypothetical protein